MGKNASRSRHHEYMLEAFEYVKRALEINENNFACHKVTNISSGGSRGGRPQPKIFSISCSSLNNLAKTYIASPPGNPGSAPNQMIIKTGYFI